MAVSDRVGSLLRRGPRALAAVLFGGGLFCGGCSNDFFVCSTDTECTEADGGRCEASGACSFPDPQCPTGRRYGEAGNPQVAKTCVPPEDLGSTGAGAGAGSQGASQTSSTDAQGTSSTAAGSDSGTTGAPGSSSGESSTGVGSSSSSSSAAASSSSTGDSLPPPDLYESCMGTEDCSNMTCAYFINQRGSVIAGFCSAAGCEDATVDCSDPGTGAVPSCEPVPLNGAPGNGCVLDCTDTGTAGCPDGMTCLTNIGGLPDLCAHQF